MFEGKVVVTRQIHSDAIDLLRDNVSEVIIPNEGNGISNDKLKSIVNGVDGIICTSHECVDVALLDAAGPSLRCVSTHSVGLDHIDLDECTARSIAVGNTPGVLSNATADLTVSLVLNAARHVSPAITAAKTGEWGTWKPQWLCGMELAGKTCGFIGLGRIGCCASIERV
eukprot:m.39121 g.39121  ORF g.39121 m.39121 type:complete len:170 (+) comp10266_c0_seq1:48-557(+)